MKNGVPWDVALEMDWEMRLGLAVIFRSLDGDEFDWENCRWKVKS